VRGLQTVLANPQLVGFSTLVLYIGSNTFAVSLALWDAAKLSAIAILLI
jgi:hypothetical protein